MIAGGLKFINTRSRLLCMETCWQSSYWHWKKLALLSSVNQLVQQEFTLVFVSSELTWQCWVTVIWSYWMPRKSGHRGIMFARFLQTSDTAEDDICGISHSHSILIWTFTSGVEGGGVTAKRANAVWVVRGASRQNCLIFRGKPDHLQLRLWQPKLKDFHGMVDHLQTFLVAGKTMKNLVFFMGSLTIPCCLFLWRPRAGGFSRGVVLSLCIFCGNQKRLFFKKGGPFQAVLLATKLGVFHRKSQHLLCSSKQVF